MGNFSSMRSMMGGGSGTAQVPTQSFSTANFIGTPVPVVGDNAARPAYAGAVGGVAPNHVVFWAVGFFAAGYLLYHFNFEK